MSDKTLKILLGIIAVNLTIQTVKDVGLFPTAYAQNDIQRVAICDIAGDGGVRTCASVMSHIDGLPALNVLDLH
jgi:hypothetical protein